MDQAFTSNSPIGQERKSKISEALSQLEAEIDSLGTRGLTSLENSFKAVMIPESPTPPEGQTGKSVASQSDALETIDRIHYKVCRINGKIQEFQNRSQA